MSLRPQNPLSFKHINPGVKYFFVFDLDKKFKNLKDKPTEKHTSGYENQAILSALENFQNNGIYCIFLTVFPDDQVRNYWKKNNIRIYNKIDRYISLTQEQYDNNIRTEEFEPSVWKNSITGRLRQIKEGNPTKKLIFFSDNEDYVKKAWENNIMAYYIDTLEQIGIKTKDALDTVSNEVIWYDDHKNKKIRSIPSDFSQKKCRKGKNENIQYDYYSGILDRNELTDLGKDYTPTDKDKIYFCSNDTSQKGGNSNYETYKINKHNFISIRSFKVH